MECAMTRKIEVARALSRNTDLSATERRRQLTQITAVVRGDYDRQIAQIRAEIAALGITAAGLVWQKLVAIFSDAAFQSSANVAAIAKLRVQLAEAHTAKFAVIAELKVLKALA